MQILLTTEMGSLYLLDTVAKYWQRRHREPSGGILRSEGGTFYEIGEVKIGARLTISCPPITEGTSLRAIVTSRVTNVVYSCGEKNEVCP